MAETKPTMVHGSQKLAQPLHVQRLESSLDIGPFMAYAQNMLLRPLTSSDDSDSDINAEILPPGDKIINGIVSSKIGKYIVTKIFKGNHNFFPDRRNDKQHMYNFSQVGADRKWLQDILLSDTDSDGEISDEDDYIRGMLKDHVKEQKYRTKYYQNANVRNLKLFFILLFYLMYVFTECSIWLLWDWSFVKL